ncbi:MAG: lspA [Marmoricola sp.]|nr:lspA [Marmoricola sp.]
MQAARGASLTSDAPPPSGKPRFGLVLGIAVIAWAVDIATKVLAVEHLAPGESKDFIGSLLKLHLTRNPGAAFSTGTGMTPFITLFGCTALVVAVVVARKVRTPVWAWAFGLLVAGIIGNLTDRMLRDPGPLRGHVVDFLELPNWPIFNVADICINIAAGLIVLQTLRGVPLAGRPPENDDTHDPSEAAA